MTTIPPKIADGVSNANDILGDRFTITTTEDGKIWFVSRKFADQPSISYFTETPLRGGNIIYFDTNTKKWSQVFQYSQISGQELLEGDVFGYKNHLFLLTYQRSRQFQFCDLYIWRDNDWRKVDRFEAHENTKFTCGDHISLKRISDESGQIYFVAEHGSRGLNIYKFQLSDDAKQGSIVLQHSIADVLPEHCGAHLVRLGASGHHLYVIYGQQRCGFYWDPNHPIQIDLQNGHVERLTVGKEVDEYQRVCPPWAFSGAHASHLISPSKWWFLGGCRARGLSSTENDQSIWMLDLDAKDWKRYETYDLPANSRFAGAFGNPAKFYVIDVNSGVYEFEPK